VPQDTRVGIGFMLGGVVHTAVIPVIAASLWIDPDDISASRIDVTLDAAGARAGLFLVTEAMLGPGILDAAHHPKIRFVTDGTRPGPVEQPSGGVCIPGLLTLRGVTRPVDLVATIDRQPGGGAVTPDDITMHLDGAISRAAFGAVGHGGLVADRVTLSITARMQVMN
jgi:polyisoprenoid-binding protein YceI